MYTHTHIYIYIYIYILFVFIFLQPCHKCNLIVILFFFSPLIFYWLLSNCGALGIVLEPCGPLMSQSMPYFTIYNTRYKCLHFFSPAEFIVPFFSTVSLHLRLACPVYPCLCPCRSVCIYVCAFKTEGTAFLFHSLNLPQALITAFG